MKATPTQKPFASFASRLNEACDDMKLPMHGRQTALAVAMGVTQGAARKWLSGAGYPDIEKIVRLCEWSGTNVNWLMMGIAPKRNDKVDAKTLVLGEALEALPDSERQQVLDFIAYKFERSGPLFTGERMARYMKMIDAFKKDRDGLK